MKYFLLFLFSPFVLSGFLYTWIKASFMLGIELAENLGEFILEKLA